MNDNFHLPPETHIGHAHLQVANLDRSLDFYVGVLGFQERRSEGHPVALAASLRGSPLILLTENKAARPRPPRTTGLYHVAIRLPNRIALAHLLRRLLHRDVPLQGFADHGVSEAIYLSDPDGNGLELYADRPRAAWSWKDGQIEMTTDQLDVEDLLTAAQDHTSPWNRIHPDTDIGHIHLQVGDLARSEQFYHGVLCFGVMQRSYPGALFLAAGEYHHHIGVNNWAGRDVQQPPSDAIGLLAFGVLIKERPALLEIQERLQLSNSAFTLVGTDSSGVEVTVGDPDGIIVQIS